VAIIKGPPAEAVKTPQAPKEFNESTTSMLSLLWTPAQDCFFIKVKNINQIISSRKDLLTKRQVLRELARLYDPLELLSLILLRSKLLF
jgi:Pao retrotransposon peptidase